MSESGTRVGADEALATLVGQFADPLSFLRELVQNSLDAASTQIDIDFELDMEGKTSKHGNASGLMTITIADNGEGMNEQIIDKHLLTLFSSTKEDDLTKIGKFGVGFVSIFAMEPEVVVLDTGQAGESWRVLFHADRSYEKLRLDEPVEGTTIRLHRRITRSKFQDIEKRGADTVRYWCKYADAELMVNGELIGEEFAIDAALAARFREPGTDLIVGYSPIEDRDTVNGGVADTLVGFYNRGLTLVEDTVIPGEGYDDLVGLSMRIKSRYLEHTLTRDDVRQDESFHKALGLVREQVEQVLRPRLIAHLEQWALHHSGKSAADAPGHPAFELALLYARVPSNVDNRDIERARIFPTVEGKPLTLRQVKRIDEPLDVPIYATESNPLTRAFHSDGVKVLLDVAGLAAHIRELGIATLPANRMFYTCLPVPISEQVEAMLEHAQHLLGKARARISRVAIGDLEYADSPNVGHLYVRQEKAFGITHIAEDDKATLLGGARSVVLNSNHPLVERCVALASSDEVLAAALLAQAVGRAEEADRERVARLGQHAIKRATRVSKARAEAGS